MSSAFQDASQRQADGPASPSGRNFAAYYSGQDRNKPGVLNRTLSHLNPFKKPLSSWYKRWESIYPYDNEYSAQAENTESFSASLLQRGKGDWGWFNPEDFTNQKREWAKQYGDQKPVEDYKLFESFFIAGLSPSTEVTDVTADAHTKKTARHDHVPMHVKQEGKQEHRGFKAKSMGAKILYNFPPEKEINSDVASFCFPHGVNPVLLERTPSMSSLNEIVYSQRFLHSDANSFTFLMKVADNLPLYGVCCLMDEIVHKAPAFLNGLMPPESPKLSRYLVAAPRCYCFLTHYPFFSLHFKVLHMIMGLERLDRITSFLEEAILVSERSLQARDSSTQRQQPQTSETSSSSRRKPPLQQGNSPEISRSHGSMDASVSRKPPAENRNQVDREGGLKLLGNGSSSSIGLPPRPFTSAPHLPPLATPPADSEDGEPLQGASSRDSAASRATSDALSNALKQVSLSNGLVDSQSGDLSDLQRRSASATGRQRSVKPGHRRSTSVQIPPLPTNGTTSAQRANSNSLLRASARMQQMLEAKQLQAQAQLRESKSYEELQQINSAPELALRVEESDGSSTSFRTATSRFATIEDLSSLSPPRPTTATGSFSKASPPAAPPAQEEATPSGRTDEPGDLGLAKREPSSRILKSHSMMPRKKQPSNSPAGAPAGAIQVMQSYYSTTLPQPGEEFEFSPDDTLQPVHYHRPALQFETSAPEHKHRCQIVNMETEAAEGLRHWAVAVLCRCLSLQNILALLSAVLLEQQIVFFCPNLGLLSAAVLSLIPLIRPFAWQSLLMPVLPTHEEMLNLLDAPVPFVMGVQYKTSDIAARCSGLVRVNIYKDSIKNADRLPHLPGMQALYAMLEPAYSVLSSVRGEAAHSRPTTIVTEPEVHATDEFVKMVEGYLNGFCCNLHLHTITDVQTSDRVSLLLKESFIESFPSKDRNFIRMFVETQMFSVYCDTIMQ